MPTQSVANTLSSAEPLAQSSIDHVNDPISPWSPTTLDGFARTPSVFAKPQSVFAFTAPATVPTDCTIKRATPSPMIWRIEHSSSDAARWMPCSHDNMPA